VWGGSVQNGNPPRARFHNNAVKGRGIGRTIDIFYVGVHPLRRECHFLHHATFSRAGAARNDEKALKILLSVHLIIARTKAAISVGGNKGFSYHRCVVPFLFSFLLQKRILLYEKIIVILCKL
jgi:hypothetical protein